MSLRFGSAQEAGLERGALVSAYDALLLGIDEGAFAGAVALVARHGVIGAFWAVGDRAIDPRREAMTHDAVFDLASLTKAIVTAPLILHLGDEGRLSLDDPLALHLPFLRGEAAGERTLRQALTHTAGFPASSSIGWSHPPDLRHAELRAALRTLTPTGVVRYSDLGFYLLGLVAESAGGQPLSDLFTQAVRAPLGLFGSSYGPVSPDERPVVPTERVHGRVLHGTVHDGKARLMGGVAGHAGLFAPAIDVALFVQAVLDLGEGRFRRFLSAQAAEAILRPVEGMQDRRTLGWNVWSSCDVPGWSEDTVGHTGFTGTSFAVDPQSQLLAILLSSRVHPHRRSDDLLKTARARFHAAVRRSLTG